MNLVAVGGGEIGWPGYAVETTELDAEVVRLAEKRRPRLVFLPTVCATQDDALYVRTVEAHYGMRLGCQVEPLALYDRTLTAAATERTIRAADIVYVGGGNTLRMMNML